MFVTLRVYFLIEYDCTSLGLKFPKVIPKKFHWTVQPFIRDKGLRT